MLSHLINHANKIKEFRVQWLGEVRECLVKIELAILGWCRFNALKNQNGGSSHLVENNEMFNDFVYNQKKLYFLLNENDPLAKKIQEGLAKMIDDVSVGKICKIEKFDQLGRQLLKDEWDKTKGLFGLPHSWLTVIQCVSFVLALSFLVLLFFLWVS